MHNKTPQSKAARPCKSSRALTVTVNIPADSVPILRAFAELYGTTPDEVATLALAGLLASAGVKEKLAAAFRHVCNGGAPAH